MQPPGRASDTYETRERAQSRVHAEKDALSKQGKKRAKASSDSNVVQAATPVIRDQTNDLSSSRSYEGERLKIVPSNGDRDGSSESSGGSSNSSIRVVTIIPGLLRVAVPAKTPDNPKAMYTPQVKEEVENLRRPTLNSQLKDKTKEYLAGKHTVFSQTNVEKIEPKLRADLLKWLQYKSSEHPALGAVIDTIKIVQKEMMDKQLIEAICLDADLREALCLNIETLMEAKPFFDIILKALESGKLTRAQTQELIGFCVRWITANRGTVFLEKAREETEKLEKHSDNIKTYLNAKLKQEEEIKPTDDTTCKESFAFSLVPKIKLSAHIGSLEEPVERTAKDILHYQVKLLRSLKPQHLVPKWGEKGKPLTSAYVAFHNNLSYYIADTILQCVLADERASMLCFYLLLCEKLCDLGDLSSAKAIIMALSQNSILRLKASWSKLYEKFAGIKERHQKLESIFDTGQNEANLRAEMARRTALKQKILPFLGTIQKDLTFSGDSGKTVTIGDDKEPVYNLTRIKAYRRTLLEALEPLAYWQEEQNTAVSNTNFVYCCYESASTKTFDARGEEHWELSVRLEPKATEPPKAAEVTPGNVTLP